MITNDIFDTLAYSSKTLSVRDNKKYNISADYLRKVFCMQEGLDAYDNEIKLDLTVKKGRFKVSVDRIDSKVGYIKGNIAITTTYCNQGKNVASLQEWVQVLKMERKVPTRYINDLINSMITK